jgi:hypothetical protein
MADASTALEASRAVSLPLHKEPLACGARAGGSADPYKTNTGADMSQPISPEVQGLKDELIEGMTDFLIGDDEDDEEGEAFDAGYTRADVDRCAAIVDHYLETLARLGSGDKGTAIMEAVREAVLELNKLNDSCDGNLIETDQRELLCELIITAAQEAGLETDAYDITEEWREW